MARVRCLFHRALFKKTKPLFFFFFFLFLLSPNSLFAKGDGIKFMGDQGSFHPRLYLGFGFDQNPLRRSSASRAVNPLFVDIISSPYFNIRPGLEFGIRNDFLTVDLKGFVNYTYFFESRLAALNQLTGKADLTLEFFKSSPVKLLVANFFSRSAGDIHTADDFFNNLLYQAEEGTQRANAFVSINNTTKVQLSIQPGGKALTVDIGYAFHFGLFIDPNLDFQRQEIYLNAKWKFFPKTALLFESNVNIVNYSPQFDFSRTSSINRGMIPFKAYLGLFGQFTDNLSLIVKLGGGYTFVNEEDPPGLAPNTPKDNWGMLIGSIYLTYNFNPTTYLRVGILHDFHPSNFTNFYHETLGVVDFASQFGGRFLLKAGVEGGFLQYGEIPNVYRGVQFNFARNLSSNSGTQIPNQGMIRGRASFDWYIFPFWTLGLQTLIEWRESNGGITTPDGNFFDLGFFRFSAAIKTELAW